MPSAIALGPYSEAMLWLVLEVAQRREHERVRAEADDPRQLADQRVGQLRVQAPDLQVHALQRAREAEHRVEHDHDADHADRAAHFAARRKQRARGARAGAGEPEALHEVLAEVARAGRDRLEDDAQRDHRDEQLRGQRERAVDHLDAHEFVDRLAREGALDASPNRDEVHRSTLCDRHHCEHVLPDRRAVRGRTRPARVVARPRAPPAPDPEDVLCAVGGVLVLLVSVGLARFLQLENVERDDELALIQAEAKGDAAGMITQLSGCRSSPACVASVRANAANPRLRRSGAVKILSLESPTAYSLTARPARRAWRGR